MARSSSCAELAIPDARRIDLGELQATGKRTKTAPIQISMQLEASGALAGTYENACELKQAVQAAAGANVELKL